MDRGVGGSFFDQVSLEKTEMARRFLPVFEDFTELWPSGEAILVAYHAKWGVSIDAPPAFPPPVNAKPHRLGVLLRLSLRLLMRIERKGALLSNDAHLTHRITASSNDFQNRH